MKKPASQLAFDFLIEMDLQAEERAKQQVRERQQRNDDSIWETLRREHPITEAEKIWLPQGIRLARHVHPRECHECDLGCEDHTERWKYEQNICLKDVRQVESQLGHEIECCYQVLHQQPVTEAERAILAQFPKEYYLLADLSDLIEKTGIPEEQLRPQLGMLHIKGLVRQIEDIQFQKTGKEV